MVDSLSKLLTPDVLQPAIFRSYGVEELRIIPNEARKFDYCYTCLSSIFRRQAGIAVVSNICNAVEYGKQSVMFLCDWNVVLCFCCMLGTLLLGKPQHGLMQIKTVKPLSRICAAGDPKRSTYKCSTTPRYKLKHYMPDSWLQWRVRIQ